MEWIKRLFKKKKTPAQMWRDMEERYDSMLKEKSASEWLNPPVDEMSEAEHKLAEIEYVYDVFLSDMLYNMSKYIRMVKEEKLDDKNFKYFEDLAREDSDFIYKMMDEKVDNWWEHFASRLQLDLIRQSITQSHAGDCTAIPASCMRCIAEVYYKIPSTVKWSKGVGYKLYLESSKK
jgi:hypothetical protein